MKYASINVVWKTPEFGQYFSELMPISPPDLQHITSAQGYVELRMFLDANDELEKIEPEHRHLPEVLAVRDGQRAMKAVRCGTAPSTCFLRLLMTIWRSLIASLAVASSVAIAGSVYYVAPTGDDTSGAGSQGSPWREIRKGLTVVQPGDTILAADGTYQGFTINGLGSITAPITIKAQGSNCEITPTMDRGAGYDPDNIAIWSSTNIVIDGFRSFNATRAAVRVISCASITIRNGVYGNNQTWAILTSHADDICVENNDLYGSKDQHGIYFANSGDHPIARGNRIHDNYGSGIRSFGDLSQGGDGIISGALFENNIIYNNGAGGGAGINVNSFYDGIIRNNLIYGNPNQSGIALFGGTVGRVQYPGVKNIQVYHNTVNLPSTAKYCLQILNTDGTITVRDNILYNQNTTKGCLTWGTTTDAANTDSDYNIVGGGSYVSTDNGSTKMTFAAWQSVGHEQHSFSSTLTSLIVNASANDYHLGPRSPAINAGLMLSTVTEDFEQKHRPQGTASDIGAYEFVPSTYGDWKYNWGLTSEIPDNADDNHDGIPLLMEYALGLDPTINQSGNIPKPVNSGSQMSLTFFAGQADVIYSAEASTDLQTWSTSGVTISPPDANNCRTATIPITGSKCFMRLKVVH
jgi:hypothetical protein